MHIIPAAGSATRMGGIPKFLLPIGQTGKSLLRFHVDMSHKADLETIVMLHPTLFDFGKELINSWGVPNVRIFSVVSPTMTKTVQEAVRLSGSSENVFSISMPDTFFSQPEAFAGSFLKELRKGAPSLALWQIREDQLGKLGQVNISNDMSYIEDMIDKDPSCNYKYAWGMMALNRELLCEFTESDPHPGISLKSKIEMGLKVSFVEAQGDYLDCGTPAEYYRAISSNLNTK